MPKSCTHMQPNNTPEQTFCYRQNHKGDNKIVTHIGKVATCMCADTSECTCKYLCAKTTIVMCETNNNAT